jgi:molybdenum cofactor cytidylyltransferase
LPTVIILASGRGRRFVASGGRGDKLQAQLAGKTVLQHVVDAAQASALPWHLEDAGHPGMGDSIAAAVRATPQANGWLILPGDLPLIRSSTLRAVAAALTGAEVVVPSYGGRRGHPVAFSAKCAEALRNLKGEQGAASLVLAHAVIELVLDDAGCVTDIDTLGDLQMAQQLLCGA